MSVSEASVDGVVEVTNVSGAGDFILVCEHASNFIPPEFDHLGLGSDALESHIAWDPGAYPVAVALSAKLDAPLITSRVSRLVYDCNRPPEAKSAVPAESETYEIPGNKNLSGKDRQTRIDQYYVPFHDALATVTDRRVKARRAPVIVTIHSFAPVYDGRKRDLDIGVLHDSDTRFADAFLRVAATHGKFKTIRNEPYGPQDDVMHTLTEHAIPRGLLNVMLEIRNDLITTPVDQQSMAEQLAEYATEALVSVAERLNDSSAVDGPCSKTEPIPIYSTVRRRNDLMFGSFAVGTS